jgi:hypothetical protein
MYWYWRSKGAIGAAVESLARPTIMWLLPIAPRRDEPRQLPPPSPPLLDPPPLLLPLLLPLPPPLPPPLLVLPLPLPPLPLPLLPASAPAAAPLELLLPQLGTTATASNPAPMTLHPRMPQA